MGTEPSGGVLGPNVFGMRNRARRGGGGKGFRKCSLPRIDALCSLVGLALFEWHSTSLVFLAHHSGSEFLARKFSREHSPKRQDWLDGNGRAGSFSELG